MNPKRYLMGRSKRVLDAGCVVSLIGCAIAWGKCLSATGWVSFAWWCAATSLLWLHWRLVEVNAVQEFLCRLEPGQRLEWRQVMRGGKLHKMENFTVTERSDG